MDQPVTFKQWYQGGHYFVHHSHPIFYRLGGHGQPGETLLLIHGFPTSSWDWHRLWPHLCERFSTVIAADLIGFGYSAKPRDYEYRIHDWADLQEHLLRELHVTRYHIVAHNIGDNIAQELLARQQDLIEFNKPVASKIESICLLNGGLFVEMQRPTLMHKLLNSRVGPMLARFFTESRFNQAFSKVFGPHTKPNRDELAEFWAQVACNGGASIGHRLVGYIQEREEYRNRWVQALVQARLPIRLIDGLADQMSGAHMVDYYRQMMPRPDVVTLPEIGHYPHIEAPRETLAAIEAFHDQLAASR